MNNRPERGEDGDFIYGSGYFPLLAGTTERFSLALVYGGGKGGSLQDDIDDLLKNKKTVQKIYDANYQFPTPPDKPTLVAVPGDKQVTLYWDRVAEASIDPVLRVKGLRRVQDLQSTDPELQRCLHHYRCHGDCQRVPATQAVRLERRYQGVLPGNGGPVPGCGGIHVQAG